MYLEKSPSAQSPSPSTSSSNYTRRPSLATHQQLQSQLPISPGSLARHGIKVRDFAYESNLPLIPSIPQVRRLVLAARPLKRTRRQIEEPDDVFMVDTHSQSQSGIAEPFRVSSLEVDKDTSEGNKSKPLERKSTEPVIIPERQRQQLFRDVRYLDASQHASSSQASRRSIRHALTPITPTTNRFSTYSPAPLPFPFPITTHGPIEQSQETEQSTDTPLVTPNGSLTWPTITSDVPASQLDSASQLPAAEDATYSQLGFSSPLSPALDGSESHADLGGGATDAQDLGTSPRLTEPGSSPPQSLPRRRTQRTNARASSPPSPSRRDRAGRRPPTGLGPTDSSPLSSNAGAGAPGVGAPRYFLRKHSSPRQDPTSPPSPHRRRKSSAKTASPYPSRVSALTRQAMHAAGSSSSGPSPRSRPLRKTTIS